MQAVTIIAVGKLKERAYSDLCAEYLRRLSPFYAASIQELPEERLPDNPSDAQIRAALQTEAARIRKAIPNSAYKIALCVEGKSLSSVDFSQKLSAVTAPSVVFLIGGSNGLDEALKKECDLRVSFSAMTFPHHLFRVMLLEQVYRSCMIQAGKKYHK